MQLETLPYRIEELAIWLGIGFVVIVSILAFMFIAERPPGATELEENQAVTAAQSDAADRFATEPDEIEVVRVQEATFSDSCLGAPRPDEVCAQVLTEGYRITVVAEGDRYVYHSDITGRSLRLVR